MAWDKTLPSLTTKMRKYPEVITNNFTAIEEGDIDLKHWQINLIERNGTAPYNDPSRADDTMMIYSKQDTDGDTEAFLMDDRDPANVIQITQDGKLGSAATSIVCNDISIGDLSLTQNNMVVAWGKFSNAGTFLYGVNMNTAGTPHPSTGLFNVDVDADVLSTANYMISGVVAKTGDSGGSVRGLMPISLPAPVAATDTTIQIEIKRDGGRTVAFDNFYIQVIGGQA